MDDTTGPVTFSAGGNSRRLHSDRLQTVKIPSRWRSHPLLVGRCFYLLPATVVEDLEGLLAPDYRRGELWQLERDLSEVAAAMPESTIGLWDGRATICCPLLAVPPRQRPPHMWRGVRALQKMISDPQMANAPRRSRNPSASPLSPQQIAQAYVGWLLANLLFVREHDQLLGQLQTAAGRQSDDPNLLDVMLPIGGTSQSTGVSTEWACFCSRWRLAGLAGPYLPVPAQPSCHVLPEAKDLQRTYAAGAVLHLPDIYPLSVLTQLVVPELEGDTHQHLEDWSTIIDAGNRNKAKHIDRLGRQLVVHHLWRILQARHPLAIRRKKKWISTVLADYVQVEPLAVQGYLAAFISRSNRKS